MEYTLWRNECYVVDRSLRQCPLVGILQPFVRSIDHRSSINEGNPRGQWINESAVVTVPLPSSGFKTVQPQASVSVAKGQVYHIVVEAAENPLNGTVAMITYQGNGFAQPLNPDDPDIIWPNSRMNTMHYDGQSWQESHSKMPIFIVGYSDGTSEGQPYSVSAPWVVWGSTYVGQMLIPASDYNIGKIAFDVSLKADQPQDKLYYKIEDSDKSVLSEGPFAQPNQLTTSQTWIEATLSTPVTLKAGQLYRIFLLSPQTNLASAYHIYGHEFCYDPLIGYGSLQHQLTSSLDDGTTWNGNSDADAIFKLTNAG